MDFRSLPVQRSEVKRGLRQTLHLGGTWEPICMEWFEKWKRYVDFDNESMEDSRPSEEVKALHPGRINNEILGGSYGDELSRKIQEGKDYVLLPNYIATKLFQHFDGGPQYPRSIYICRQMTISPKPHVLYFKDAKVFGDVVYNLRNLSEVRSTNIRVWIKLRSDSIVTINPILGDYVPENGIIPKRFLTSDQTEVIDGWKLNTPPDTNIEDLLSDRECLELIAEEPLSSDKIYPRDPLLQEWKKKLLPGDVVDCQDKDLKWWEGIVKVIDEEGNVHIHFRGWDVKFDEIIKKVEITRRIQPLYSKSRNWRAKIDEDDIIDLKIISSEENKDGKVIWIPVMVEEIDLANQKICVSYKKELVDVHVASMSLSDDSKNQANIGRLSSLESDERIRKWVYIQSEDIAAQNTHTPVATATTKKTNFQDNSLGYYGGGYSNYSSYSYDNSRNEPAEDNHIPGRPTTSGAVGLRNLGNTCFMNSILQCLSNTDLLTSIFLTNKYKSQLNFDNPLGHGGKLAQVYAKLLKAMWSDAYSVVVPRLFKRTIGEFQPQFSGYEQHDSQELMGFLIDGLHEDLNRIKKKPFVEAIESNGRDDTLMSSESWRRYLLRNDSELVDILYGQTKSHVTCINCKRESVTFEAFNCLSLPIPIKNTKTIEVIVQLLPAGSDPVKVKVEIKYGITVKEFKSLIVLKLISCGLLEDKSKPKPNDSKSDVIMMDNVIITTSMMDSENEYVSISKKKEDEMSQSSPVLVNSHGEFTDDEDDDDLKLQGKQRHQQVSDVPTITPVDNSIHGYHFHLCTLWTSNMNRLSNTLADTAAILKSVNNIECYYFVQLEHDAPIRQTYSSYSYSYQGNNNIPTGSVNTVDIFFGDTTDNRFSSYITLNGFCHRMSYMVSKISYHEVHEYIWDLVKRRYIPNTSKYYTDGDQGPDYRPYDLQLTSSFGTDQRGPLATGNNLFSIGYEALLVRWKNGIRNSPDNFLSEKLTFIRPVKGPDDEDNDSDDDGNSMSFMDIDDDTYKPKSNRKKPSNLSLYNCLEAFSVREKLPDTETFYCSGCKQHLPPLKKMDIWAAPDVLLIHLKRFQYTQGQYYVHRDKISDVVDFPVDGLDLTQFVKGPIDEPAPPIYDLYAVSHHSGSLHGGHYTAVCKNPKNSKWYNFNDSSVSETSPDSAVSSLSYVLFYKRRTGSLRWGGIQPLKEELSNSEPEK